MEIFGIVALTVVASIVGTVSGFGLSTIMVPIVLMWLPVPTALLLVGFIHWFGDLWKVLLFRRGIDWRLILAFGIPGIVAAWFGAGLVVSISRDILLQLFGAFLALYGISLIIAPSFAIKPTISAAAFGGGASGFLAGIFGVGGAVRGAVLAAFNLPKEVYIATAGTVGLAIDTSRLFAYWSDGATFGNIPSWSLAVFVAASFIGAGIARNIITKIPQEQFRMIIAVFLVMAGINFLIQP